MKEYITSKEQCSKMIKGVCRQCGGELEPIETVDNGGDPTFWAGCMKCHIYCNGCDYSHYKIAQILVDDCNFIYYSHMNQPKSNPITEQEKYYFEYYRHSQISGAVGIVENVLRIYETVSLLVFSKDIKITN